MKETCKVCQGTTEFIELGLNNRVSVNENGDVSVVVDGKEVMAGQATFCPCCGRRLVRNGEPQKGDDIWYVDPDVLDIECGTVSNLTYNTDGQITSFSVDFEGGDFDEFDGVAIGKYFFFSQAEAEEALKNFQTNKTNR